MLVSVLFVAMVLISACTANSKLDKAMKQWNAHGITNYRIEVWYWQSVWHEHYYEIEVDGSEISHSVTCMPAPAEGHQCDLSNFDPSEYTIEGLFRTAQQVLYGEFSKWAEITYNTEFGYPESIKFDDPDAIDEETVWIVVSFEALP